MACQLIYTSAPRLLQAGRTGFGTVAKHGAIRAALQAEVERFSQFSRQEGLHLNRIVVQYRHLSVAGETFHIISRIKDSGADYTGRTNHIAHHVIFTSTEIQEAIRFGITPADVISNLNSRVFWKDSWHEGPMEFCSTDEILISSFSRIFNLPAESWKSFTGKPENAAILAPGITAESCWIIVPPGQPDLLLGLIGESLCLHPNPWRISFSTELQPTDRIEEIAWRGIPASSPLCSTAAQSVRPTIDLTQINSLPPPSTDFATVAANGKPQQLETTNNEATEKQASLSANLQELLLPSKEIPLCGPKTGAVSLPTNFGPKKLSERKREAQGEKPSSLKWILAMASCLLFVGGGTYYLFQHKAEKALELAKNRYQTSLGNLVRKADIQFTSESEQEIATAPEFNKASDIIDVTYKTFDQNGDDILKPLKNSNIPSLHNDLNRLANTISDKWNNDRRQAELRSIENEKKRLAEERKKNQEIVDRAEKEKRDKENTASMQVAAKNSPIEGIFKNSEILYCNDDDAFKKEVEGNYKSEKDVYIPDSSTPDNLILADILALDKKTFPKQKITAANKLELNEKPYFVILDDKLEPVKVVINSLKITKDQRIIPNAVLIKNHTVILEERFFDMLSNKKTHSGVEAENKITYFYKFSARDTTDYREVVSNQISYAVEYDDLQKQRMQLESRIQIKPSTPPSEDNKKKIDAVKSWLDDGFKHEDQGKPVTDQESIQKVCLLQDKFITYFNKNSGAQADYNTIFLQQKTADIIAGYIKSGLENYIKSKNNTFNKSWKQENKNAVNKYINAFSGSFNQNKSISRAIIKGKESNDGLLPSDLYEALCGQKSLNAASDADSLISYYATQEKDFKIAVTQNEKLQSRQADINTLEKNIFFIGKDKSGTEIITIHPTQ